MRSVTLKFPKSEKYNFTKNLVKRHKLVTHLDRCLATEPENFHFSYEAKQKDDAWHPSGHCTPVASELYQYALSDHNKPRDISVSLQKTFLVGHFWHQLLQHAVLKLGFAEPDAVERRGSRWWGDHIRPSGVENWGQGENVEARTFYAMEFYRKEDLHYFSYPEQRIYPDPDKKDWVPNEEFMAMATHWPDDDIGAAKIRPKPFHWATGMGDLAPCSIPHHGDYVVDFKTMSSHQFKGNDIPGWAAHKYEAQINIYMDWFDCEQALIVAINKDTPHDMKEFEFRRNQPLVDAIYDKWLFVSECLDANEAPTPLDDNMFQFDSLYKGPIAQ
jgi:hypothetical protein